MNILSLPFSVFSFHRRRQVESCMLLGSFSLARKLKFCTRDVTSKRNIIKDNPNAFNLTDMAHHHCLHSSHLFLGSGSMMPTCQPTLGYAIGFQPILLPKLKDHQRQICFVSLFFFRSHLGSSAFSEVHNHFCL